MIINDLMLVLFLFEGGRWRVKLFFLLGNIRGDINNKYFFYIYWLSKFYVLYWLKLYVIFLWIWLIEFMNYRFSWKNSVWWFWCIFEKIVGFVGFCFLWFIIFFCIGRIVLLRDICWKRIFVLYFIRKKYMFLKCVL